MKIPGRAHWLTVSMAVRRYKGKSAASAHLLAFNWDKTSGHVWTWMNVLLARTYAPITDSVSTHLAATFANVKKAMTSNTLMANMTV